MGNTTIDSKQGHWMLAKMGKKVLRPGGKELTQKLIENLKINSNDLPGFWNCYPETSALHHYGDKLVQERKYLALKVPSAVTQGDFNYLINPHHEMFEQVKIVKMERFPFDKRLISL